MIKAIALILSIVVSLGACKSGAKKEEVNTESKDSFPYHIFSPDKRYELPKNYMK